MALTTAPSGTRKSTTRRPPSSAGIPGLHRSGSRAATRSKTSLSALTKASKRGGRRSAGRLNLFRDSALPRRGERAKFKTPELGAIRRLDFPRIAVVNRFSMTVPVTSKHEKRREADPLSDPRTCDPFQGRPSRNQSWRRCSGPPWTRRTSARAWSSSTTHLRLPIPSWPQTLDGMRRSIPNHGLR
jgi:hypothetical protein